MYLVKSKYRLFFASFILAASFVGLSSQHNWHESSQALESNKGEHFAPNKTPNHRSKKVYSSISNWPVSDNRVAAYEQIKRGNDPRIDSKAIPDTSTANQLTIVEAMVANPKSDDQKKLAVEFQKLTALIMTDPEVRKVALDRFLDTAGTEMGNVLGAVLSSTNDPVVESAVLNLAQNGTSPEQRLAAMEMLGQSSVQQQSTREILLNMLMDQTEGDDRVISAAMSTLTSHGSMDINDKEDVINTLKPYTESNNPQLREQGIRSLAEWSPQNETVLKTVTSATQDADASVRASALESLGQSGFHFEDVRDAILTKLQDPKEDFKVRLAAWQTLETYPMDEQTYSTYAEFKRNYPSQISGAK